MYDELKRQGQLKASRAEGKAEGVELAKTAINMLKDGVAIGQICKETGLTEAQVAFFARYFFPVPVFVKIHTYLYA